MLGAHTRYAKCPPVSDESLADWLCLMQHYGLPTRLLDWTASPLVAAFFAVAYEEHPGDGVIWQLDPAALNRLDFSKDLLFLLHGTDVRGLLLSAFNFTFPSSDKAAAVLGSEIDLRMTVQQGSFTIHGNKAPLESHTESASFLVKFVIPEKAKTQFARELRLSAIRRSALFPDLGNLATELSTDIYYHTV